MKRGCHLYNSLLKRLQKDGRLAYLTEAYAETTGVDAEEFRQRFEKTLKPQKVPPLD